MLIKRRPGVLHEMAATWQQCDRRQAQWIYTPSAPCELHILPVSSSHILTTNPTWYPSPLAAHIFCRAVRRLQMQLRAATERSCPLTAANKSPDIPSSRSSRISGNKVSQPRVPVLLCLLLLVSKQTVVAAGSRGVATDPRRATSKTIPRQTC